MQINELDSSKNLMQNVKQRFFALRNGIVADTLRKAGSPYRIIFGLNIPQLKEVASVIGYNEDLAHQLWENFSTRESRLLAPMLMNPDHTSKDILVEMIGSLSPIPEEADILCHFLLRKTSFVDEFIDEFRTSDVPMRRYLALRLMFGRVAFRTDEALKFAESEIERNDPLTRNVACQLKEEALLS